MKTAVSLPDELFTKAEDTAKRLGISRSRLFAIALEKYLREREHENITTRLNEIYDSQNSSLDSTIVEMQHASIGNENW